MEQDNLDFILKSTECKCVVYSNQFKRNLPTSVVTQVNECQLDEIISNQNFEHVSFSKEFDQNRIAEILYTSGSTGIPKGVMISHLNIIANTNSIISYLKLGASDIMGVVLPFYYCYGLSLLHTHLKVGASLVLINNFIFIAFKNFWSNR